TADVDFAAATFPGGIDHGRRTHRDFRSLDGDSAARGSAPGGRDMAADGGVSGRGEGDATAGGTHRGDRGGVPDIHFAAGYGNLRSEEHTSELQSRATL